MKNLTLFNVETLFKDRFYCCLESLKGNKFLLVFLMVMGSFFTQGISAQGTLVPSCNLVGPLEACAVLNASDTSGDFIINIEVARSGAPNYGTNPLTGNTVDHTFNNNFAYSFVSNTAGAFIRSYGVVTYNVATNKTTQSLVVCPGTNTPEFNLQLNVTNTSSSPNTFCECSKSVSVSKVAVTSTFTPITCFGQLSTLTAVGQFSDINSYTYTLLPSGPSNSNGVFAGLPGSEAGITYIINCTSAEGCETTTQQTITQPAYNPVVLTCPQDSISASCLTQDQVNTAFNAWLASFSASGGTNRVVTRTPLNPVAPNACGGTITVQWSATEDCTTTPVTCSSTFTVPTPPAVTSNAPANSTTSACIYADQAAATAAFNAWLAQFTVGGGCSPVGSYGQPQAPNYCGGSTTVTYNVSDRCYPGSTIERVFTITAPPAVQANGPESATSNACSYADQAAATAAFNAWLAEFTVSGGCAPSGSYGTPEPPFYCGGSVTVTYNVTDKCYEGTQLVRTFTIVAPAAVLVNAPANSTTSASAYVDQAAADAAFAAWLAQFSVSGGCAPSGSYGQPQAPLYCGGTITVHYTVTDKCYETTTTDRTFTITPVDPPVIGAPANSSTNACIYADQAAAIAAYNAWLAQFTVSGGIAPVGSFGEGGAPAAPAYCGGTVTVTYTVTDRCYEPIITTRTFTITPPPAVTVNGPDNSTSNACSYADQDAANAAFTAWLAGFTVGGGCSPVGVLAIVGASPTAPINAPLYCGGSVTVSYTVTDKCYQGSTIFGTFTITPPPAVNVTAQENSTTSACIYADQAAATAAFNAWLGGFSVSGGCSPIGSFGEGNPSAPAYCGGATTVTYTVTDKCYQQTQYTATFTITAPAAVVVNGPDNATSNACSYADQAAATAAFNAWLAGFTVSGGCAPSGSYGEPQAPAYCGGSTTVTYTVSDKCYQGTTIERTFTITPAQAVVVNGPDNSTASACAYADQAAATAAFNAWLAQFTVTGGCAPVGSFGEGTPQAPNACGGSRTVVYTVSDKCYPGSSIERTFTITPAPAVNVTSAQNSTTASCSYANQDEATAAFNTWLQGFTVSGGCAPIGSFGEGTPQAPALCGGSTTVTYTVSDKCYQQTQYTATFTITAPAPVVVNADTVTYSSCAFANQQALNDAFAAWLAGFEVSGGCAPVATPQGQPQAPALCGGTTCVTFLVTDRCYTGTVTIKFTVTPPPAVVVNGPESATSNACSYADQAAATAAFNAWLAQFSATGGCAPLGSFGEGTPQAPAYCGGTTTVVYTVTDRCYQGAPITATFTITAPAAVTANGPANSTTSACSYADQAAATAAFNAWLAEFTVSGGCAPTGSYGTPQAPNACGGSTTVVYNVTDKCYAGSSIERTFTITAPPAVTVTAPDNATSNACTYANQAAATAAFNAWLAGFSVSGGCAPVGSFGEGTPQAPAYCGGTTTVIYTASDKCYQGTPVTRTFTITPAPAVVFNCGNNVTVPACSTQAQVNTAWAAFLASTTASGGCNNGTITNNAPANAPSACGGSVDVTWTYNITTCGETQSCTRTFTVASAPAVVFNCGNNVTVPACSTQAQVNTAWAAFLASTTASGGCNGVLTKTSCNPPSICGGSVDVTWTYTVGSCGQTQSCTRTFTVATPAPAAISCGNNVTLPACSTQAQLNAAWTAFLNSTTASGGCGGVLTRTSCSAPSLCGGYVDVTWKYTVATCGQQSGCGSSNYITCTRRFTVEAPAPVAIHCGNNVTVPACSTQAQVDAAWATFLASTTATGGCGGVLTNNATSAPSICGGYKDVTWTYTVASCAPQSGCGTSNTVTCTKRFTVAAPSQVVFNCGNNVTVPACSTQAQINAAWTAFLNSTTASGGCGGQLTRSTATVPPACGGYVDVTWTYTVASCGTQSGCNANNQLTCTKRFTVAAATPVVFTCGTDVTVPACSTQAQVNTAWNAFLASTTASGGCNGVFSRTSPSTPSSCGGSVSVTWTYASTACGGQTSTQTCTRTFTVAAPAPVVLTANNFTLPACSTQAQLNTAWTAFLNSATATGGCGGVLTRSSCYAPSLCGGYVDVTWTYTVAACGQASGCGTSNTGTQSQSITRRFTVATPDPITFSAGNNVTLPACSTQAQLNAAWTAFLNSTTVTGGCGTTLTRTSCSAPALCGGYVDVTWTATTTSCGQQSGCGSSNSQSVTRRFTVLAPSQVTFTCGNNVTVSGTSTQAQITAAWNTFLNSTSANGGCNGTFTRTNPAMPTTCGQYADVTWTYTVGSCGQQSGCGSSNQLTCTKRFTIGGGSSSVTINVSDVTLPSCKTQAQVNAAWASFLASATVSGNGTLTNNGASKTIPSACGGYADVTWTYTGGGCGQVIVTCGGQTTTTSGTYTVTRRFTVQSGGGVNVSGPSNVTYVNTSFNSQYALNNAFACWLAQFTTVSSGCGSTAVFSGDPRTAPSWTNGGTVRVTYSITGNCNSDSVCATFTVTKASSNCKTEVPAEVKNAMDVKAYPNPFSENFNLDLTSASQAKVAVAIYDMTGKLIEQREVSADEVSGLQVGERFPTGVYNVIVTQGTEVKTLRVIKR